MSDMPEIESKHTPPAASNVPVATICCLMAWGRKPVSSVVLYAK